MRSCALLTLAALAAAGARPARAAFTITIGNATVTHGSTAVVDVTVAGGPELLDFFAADFVIAAVGPQPTPGGLRFTNPPTIPFDGDTNYVHYGNLLPLTFGQGVSTGVNLNDTFTVTDFNVIGSDVSAAKLLARFEISALTGLTDGWQYQISLGAGTIFQDPDSADVGYTVSGGLITIDGVPPDAAAAPAPPTLLAGLVGVGAVAVLRRRRVAPAAA